MISTLNLERIAQNAGSEISESLTYSARLAKFSGIPANLHPDVEKRIKSLYPNGLYTHQAKAIALGLEGRSVCVATPTASGKTLTFSAIAISSLLSNQGTTILALYPAKALLHDQERKWEDAARGTGLKITVIDGGVEVSQRTARLAQAQIILMTPDVLHAWLMSKLDQTEFVLF